MALARFMHGGATSARLSDLDPSAQGNLATGRISISSASYCVSVVILGEILSRGRGVERPKAQGFGRLASSRLTGGTSTPVSGPFKICNGQWARPANWRVYLVTVPAPCFVRHSPTWKGSRMFCVNLTPGPDDKARSAGSWQTLRACGRELPKGGRV